MHPWEDWAETFAHYLHIHDTLQSAAAFGLRLDGPTAPELAATPPSEPAQADFAEILASWLLLCTALNAISRSMGRDDLYPFTRATAVNEKLASVHDRLRSSRDR
jgi:hypothetical protein